jgi:hypothetical protein
VAGIPRAVAEARQAGRAYYYFQEPMPIMNRRRFLSLAALAPAAVAGCRSDGLTIFGYRVGANALYDTNIRTVYVPLFQNRAFQWMPFRRIEVDITEEVVRQINAVTPYHTTSDCDRADTELLGTVVGLSKTILNRSQQNQVREGEVVVWVDVVWRDLRDGKILSNPRRGARPADVPPLPFDPECPPPPDQTPLDTPTPARIVATGRYIPELGETNASAAQRVQNQVAVQIVSMMEKQW